MKPRIIVNGARGKMGLLACETIRTHPEFDLVAELGRQDDLDARIVEHQADIVVDLTRADQVYQNTLTIIRSGAHPVIGTSGLSDTQIQELQALCAEKKLGGIIAPNFSIGAILMMNFAEIAARFLPEVEIIEAHHQQKLDAPSGTAMKTAELISRARHTQTDPLPLKEIMPGARGASHLSVHIHSLRLPGILARQQVVFGGTGETLTLEHNSIDRASFMPGIVLACRHVLQMQSLCYGLEHLLSNK